MTLDRSTIYCLRMNLQARFHLATTRSRLLAEYFLFHMPITYLRSITDVAQTVWTLPRRICAALSPPQLHSFVRTIICFEILA